MSGETRDDAEAAPPAAKRARGGAVEHAVLDGLPALRVTGLNGDFGALVESDPPLSPAELRRADVGAALKRLWYRHGVVVVRGLRALTPEDLVAVSAHFGEVEQELTGGRAHAQLPGLPVLRLGNVRDASGRLISVPSSSRTPLPPGGCRYRPAERLPVWHTDSCHRARAPAGSALFCAQAPAEGAATCFADAVAALELLSPEERARLEGLECICSLAHHDRKLQLRKPDYPAPTPEQRRSNPPRRVPVVLTHPATGRRAFYGMGSSTCCVIPVGETVSQEGMDRYDLEGVEDESVQMLRDLLPRFTGPEHTIVWQWREGDLVVWDNRSTMHAGTGYDETQYVREMWRTTILPQD